MTTNLLATNAYAALGRLTQGGGGGAAAAAIPAQPTGGNFADMVEDAVKAVADSGHAADAKTESMVQGKADLVDVVTAVAESELALETLVSVRDRMISAYEEIMRMPI
ncbi:flagellar hook-basal body complex protein FliE 1 [Agaricicola taiwanensis]|uniref:Flagellar hook-basal body complex protein FliE n=1 Tax=Agaricicola taiwanensis TaxID=591372 RepID=A0A8J2YDR5_9RHOB|nr:flagellar hook-basal body complex protein FliE [Agaricicola taiwanensis]GGE40718.1 flagellar hook-basal body complex protein FliE 1 [Agaricicola taiwanensis]